MRRAGIFCFLMVSLTCGILPGQGMAENSTQSDSIDDVKQKLTNVEQQVKEQKQALDEQRLKAKRMEKQVDCNWRLLNDYKSCEEKFNKPSSEYLSCTSDAKQVYQQCLAAIDGD